MVSIQFQETIEAARRTGDAVEKLDRFDTPSFLQLVSETEGRVERASELRREAKRDPASADELRRRSTQLFEGAISAWKDEARRIKALADEARNEVLESGSLFRTSADERTMTRGELESRSTILVSKHSTLEDVERELEKHNLGRGTGAGSHFIASSIKMGKRELIEVTLENISQEVINAEIELDAVDIRYRKAEEAWRRRMEIFARDRYIAQVLNQWTIMAKGLELNTSLEDDRVRMEVGEIKYAKIGVDYDHVVSIQENNVRDIKVEEAATEEAREKFRAVEEGVSRRYGAPFTGGEREHVKQHVAAGQLASISGLRETIASQPFITLATYGKSVSEQLGNTTLFAAFRHDTGDGMCKIVWASEVNSRHAIRAAEEGGAVISIARTNVLPGWGNPAGAVFDVTVRRLEDPEEVARAMFTIYSVEQMFYGKEFPGGVNPQAVLNYSGDSGVSMYEATIHRISVPTATMVDGQIVNKSVPINSIPHHVILGL